MEWFFGWFIGACLFGMIGFRIGEFRGLEQTTGAAIGFVLGPVGCVLIMLFYPLPQEVARRAALRRESEHAARGRAAAPQAPSASATADTQEGRDRNAFAQWRRQQDEREDAET